MYSSFRVKTQRKSLALGFDTGDPRFASQFRKTDSHRHSANREGSQIWEPSRRLEIRRPDDVTIDNILNVAAHLLSLGPLTIAIY